MPDSQLAEYVAEFRDWLGELLELEGDQAGAQAYAPARRAKR